MGIRELLRGKPDAAGGFSPLSPEHQERQKLFAEYWKYYRGKHRKALKVEPGKADDNVTLNLSKRVVNKGVQFLFGKPVTFETAEGSKRTQEEQYLDAVWGSEEEKSTLLQKIAMNGGVTGTVAVRLYEPDTMQPDSLPRLVNLDPAILDVVTAEDDCEDVRSYRLVWPSGEKQNRLWKRHRFDVQLDGTWVITEEVARTGSPDWQVTLETAWPYPFAPLATCQNLPVPNEFWGISDLEEADINDAINFNASNSARILKFHAHPKTIGKGFAAKDLQTTAIDEFWSIPNPEADVFNLEMQSDLSAAYTFLQTLKETYAKVANTPELDPAQVNVGALSGFALTILYGDLIGVTYIKRNTYGHLLGDLNARLLHLGGVAEYESVPIKNVWKNPLPENAMEDAQVLEIDRRNGLSMETYLERRGYNVQQEKERKQQEEQARATLADDLMRQFERGNAAMTRQNGMSDRLRNGNQNGVGEDK